MNFANGKTKNAAATATAAAAQTNDHIVCEQTLYFLFQALSFKCFRFQHCFTFPLSFIHLFRERFLCKHIWIFLFLVLLSLSFANRMEWCFHLFATFCCFAEFICGKCWNLAKKCHCRSDAPCKSKNVNIENVSNINVIRDEREKITTN